MMSGAAASEIEATSGKQNGETFNEEMKDYAKSTMNELLGMFGYGEEITREAVEELQIRLLPEEDEQPRSNVPGKTEEAEKNNPAIISTEETPYVVQIPGTENENITRVLPSSAVNNAVSPVQPLPKTAVNPSVPSETNKPGTALAPHFLAEPPNVKGVYCVVANLPVVNSGCKTNMTFKFWNCIMCSEYFVQKPEVVFRVEHPHLFGSHPAWLYQAAVCQKCHLSLKSSKDTTLTASASQNVSLAACGVNAASNDQENKMVTKSVSHAPESNAGVFVPNSLVESTSCGEEPLPSTATTSESNDNNSVAQVFFDCFICSKPVYKNSRHGKMRRSKYPTLFSNLPESVGFQRVCFTCSERLTRQRDRYVHAGIAEEDRDYAAHIKIWTGKDFSSKLSPPTTKDSDCSSCFVCEKYIPPNVNQEVKTLNRTRFPSLFSAVPGQIIKLLICDSCHRKLVKVKSRFDENNTVEEERDYWVYINSWRDRKGLENHLYSTHYP